MKLIQDLKQVSIFSDTINRYNLFHVSGYVKIHEDSVEYGRDGKLEIWLEEVIVQQFTRYINLYQRGTCYRIASRLGFTEIYMKKSDFSITNLRFFLPDKVILKKGNFNIQLHHLLDVLIMKDFREWYIEQV